MKPTHFLPAIAAAVLTVPALGQTPGFSTVVEFTGMTGDRLGSEPGATLMQHSDGNLYGTTLSGGRTGTTDTYTYGYGTIYKLTLAGGFSTITQFSGPTDVAGSDGDTRGFYPFCTLAENSDGSLYGTCSGLDATDASTTFAGYGNTFKISTSGVATFFSAFSGQGQANRGQKPIAGFVRVNSDFYGSTDGGGVSSDYGTLFKTAAATGVTSYLLDFTYTGASNRGSQPSGRMVNGGDGYLYGSTYGGGASGFGTLFKYNYTTGVLTTLVEFTGTTSPVMGKYPADALLLASDGNFYGTTPNGGTTNSGTVFRYNRATNTLTTLVEFTDLTGSAQGAGPFGGLVQGPDGYLYGVTQYGGQSGDYGTIFRLSLSGVLMPRFVDFSGTSGSTKGAQPYGGLMKASNGVIYGTTLYGGSGNFGTIWKLDTMQVSGSPTVTTEAASSVTASGATLNGTINPNSLATDWQFEYGTTTSYGSVMPGVAGSLAAGSTVETVSTTISGLAANTTYHFRLRGTSTAGTSTGADRSFTTGTTGTVMAPVAVTGAATEVTGSAAVLNGTVNPRGATTSWQFTYGATVSANTFSAPVAPGVLGDGFTAQAVSVSVTGLTPGTQIYYRIKATNAMGEATGTVGTFTTAAAPVAVTQSAAEVTATEATLVGTVDPNGTESAWQFEYGPTTRYGSLAPALPGTTGTGSSPELVVQTLTNLAPGTVIHYRLKATNSAGTSTGEDMVFTTRQAPVVTAAVQNITPTSAMLSGAVNPNGYASTWQFDYGTTASYGNSGPASPGSTGSGTVAENVSFALSGLQPNTTYHFRLRAASAIGATNGPDLTFTTANNLAGWRVQYFGAAGNTGSAANTEDPDKDGVINLLEYAFGLNPNVKDHYLLPGPSFNGSTLVASFASPPGVFDIVYSAEVSTNLINWSPVADGGTGNVHSFGSPLSPGGKNYMRLKVSVIP